MSARWTWLVGVVILLGACAPSGGPDPVATEAALRTAVAATATALAPRQTAPPASSPTPILPLGAPAATLTRAASPVAAGTPAFPQPAASGTPGARLTADEAAYINGVAQVIQEFNRSYDRFGELLDQPDLEDAAWHLAFSAVLGLWANGADLARNVRSPEALLPVHRRVLEGLDLYQQAARQLTDALQSHDEAGFNRGLDSVRQARRSFALAEAELNRFARERGL